MSKSKVNRVKHIDLTKIENPGFLKDFSYKELNALADDIRAELLRVTSTYGGHLSSNLGAVELTIALERSFDFSKDKLIFDVGHQSYTHKILTGRSLEKLRTTEGVSGFQKCLNQFMIHMKRGIHPHQFRPQMALPLLVT